MGDVQTYAALALVLIYVILIDIVGPVCCIEAERKRKEKLEREWHV